MASRIWNQINSVKYLKHGTLRTYSSVADRSQLALNSTFKRQTDFCSSPESGLRNLSVSKDLSSSVEPSTSRRFVRNAPGPIRPSDAAQATFRPSLRYRIANGTNQVAKNAQDAFTRSSCVVSTYSLRDVSDMVPDDGEIQAMKRKYQRIQTVARLQPQSVIPFCSKTVPSFESENIRPTKFIAIKVPKRTMSTSSHSENADTQSHMSDDLEMNHKEMPDNISIRSDLSYGSTHSAASAGTAGTTGSAVSMGTPDEIDTIMPAGPSRHLTDRMNKAGPSTEKTHVGYNFTQLKMTRPFSTFCRQVSLQTQIVPKKTQMRLKHDDPCAPAKCGQKVKDKRKKAKKERKIYKHHGRWDKCECCPEMLPCDETICTYVYPFPCPCDKWTEMCPIDCPPPCEPPPPRPVPLCRPPKCPVYQKLKERCPDCPPMQCVYVEPRRLPPIKSDCYCVEPYVPDKMPKIKFVKKRVYQCQPCPAAPCCDVCVDNIVAPKKLPPIIPGDCPCIEPEICDVPPLPRLNMQAYQKIKECTLPCPIELEKLKCIEKRILPKIPCPCRKIIPPPLNPVPLVRLPPICVCPEPPDPKCCKEKCPLRSDEVCKWQFPKKKLRNYFCPQCKMPKSKYKWCNCHTRGHKNCREWRCKRCMCTMCVNEGTCTVRHFSSFARKGETQSCDQQTAVAMVGGNTGLLGSSILKRINTTWPVMPRRFHLSTANSKKRCTPKKKKKKKVDCGPLCGSVCCEPRARTTCRIDLPPLCCRVKKAPYPAFSECGSDFAELLSCECKLPMSYLQPRMQNATHHHMILKEPSPKWKIIDPVYEEHCVLHDLCRPKGHTYTCETFHKGEVVPITQYECFSPHRLPCCERDQICDFKFRKAGRKCDGNKKEREFYRCECACAKQKKCQSIDAYTLNTTKSKVRKGGQRTPRDNFVNTKRKFSTLARRNIEVPPRCNALPIGIPESLPTSTGAAGFHNTGVASKQCCIKKCTPKCPHHCKRKKEERKQCGCPMRPAYLPGAIPKGKPAVESLISTQLKQHFTKSMECSGGGKARRRLLMAQAKCAAKRVGMKLTPDHDSCCKHKKVTCTDKISGGKCETLAECKRPKNICCECDPRYEVDECRPHNWVADCCEMPPGRVSGEDFRARQPDCCKMPLYPCQECMRVRGDCSYEYMPCCVTEAPFPAFSDCHPPFKRLIRNECQMQEFMEEMATRKISKMLGQGMKKYSTATPAGLLSVIEEEPSDIAPKQESVMDKVKTLFAEKLENSGLDEPVDYNPTACSSVKSSGFRNIRPDLRRNIKTALPVVGDGLSIDNIPELLFDKDEIFKQVDRENLISLAPKEMTPVEKVKSYLFNKANNVTDAAAPPLKLPVDGFECFVSPTSGSTAATTPRTPSGNSTRTITNGCDGVSRNYSTSKAAKELYEDDAEAAKEKTKTPAEEQRQGGVPKRKVVTLSKTTDLVYMLADGKNTIDLSPRKSVGEKVKVIPHPVCTHIMLDSGELLLENQYHLMNTILPLKNRIYLPYGLSHEEHFALEQKSIKSIQLELEKMLVENENS